jgi:membrane-associated phospholipid phosphatase
MSHLPFHDQQLYFIAQLAQNRPEWLNPFFRLLYYFDTPYFFFILIPIVWLGISYQWGLRIFYWFSLNNLLILSLKTAFGWPRPNTEHPELGLFPSTSYGFPSGGALICMFLGGLLITYWRTTAAWIIGCTYILLVSFSRLYLGVHYPLDILGGWIVAWIMLFLFITLNDPIERFLIKKGPPFCLALTFGIPLLILPFAPPHPAIRDSLSAAMGIGLGTYLSFRYHLFLPPAPALPESVCRSLLGIALIFLALLFSSPFLAAFLMSFGASPFIKKIYY